MSNPAVSRTLTLSFVGAAVVIGAALCSGSVQESRAPVVAVAPAPAPAPAPPPPAPADLIAEVDRLADVARTAKGAGPALDAWDAADEALTAAEAAGAPPSDVAARRKVISAKIATYECAFMGGRRAGPVRDMLLTQMANAGMSGNVRVSGRCNDAVTIEWALWSDVTVHEFQRGRAGQAIAEHGFTRIVFRAYDGTTWTWEPAKN